MNAMKENNIESVKDVVLCFFFRSLFSGAVLLWCLLYRFRLNFLCRSDCCRFISIPILQRMFLFVRYIAI